MRTILPTDRQALGHGAWRFTLPFERNSVRAATSPERCWSASLVTRWSAPDEPGPLIRIGRRRLASRPQRPVATPAQTPHAASGTGVGTALAGPPSLTLVTASPGMSPVPAAASPAATIPFTIASASTSSLSSPVRARGQRGVSSRKQMAGSSFD